MDIILEKKAGKLIRPDEAKDGFKKLKDGFYMVTVKKGSKRSLEQNSYYWTILTIIQDDTGIDKDELHDGFKNLFLRSTHVSDAFGEMTIIGSTTKLTVGGFIEYMEKIQLRCIEHGYDIPLY